jgi:hypothetical protein
MSLLTTIYEDEYEDKFVDALERNMCSAIPVIPQNLETCWFNAILMAMIYSDGLSKLVIKKVVDESWYTSRDKFKEILTIFVSYVFTIKLKKFESDYVNDIKSFQKYLETFTVEDLLNFYFSIYDDKLLPHIRHGFDVRYIYELLKKLNFNCYLITMNIRKQKLYENVIYNYESNLFIPYTDDLDKENPPDDLDKGFPPDILLIEILNNLKIHMVHSSINYPETREINISDIGNKELNYRGNLYELDSILLTAIIKDDNYHAILGLTCNGGEYVYNGWKLDANKPCKLMPFEWKTRFESFSLKKTSCGLIKGNKSFNFEKNERIMVYIKKDVLPENSLSSI